MRGLGLGLDEMIRSTFPNQGPEREVGRCLLVLSLCLASCGADPGAAFGKGCDPDVEAALSRLIERPADEWAFVIVEHAASEKFVQFATESGALFTDLPLVALAPDERERARALFAELGVPAPITAGAPTPGSGEPYEVSTFQKRFGTDTKAACRFADRVLREVYLLPEEAPVSIIEDGD